jgi:2-haloacid dehalogenase
MVAVHPFDLHGAKTVGLQTAWINRTDATYPPFYKPPDVTATSFEDLLKRIPDAARIVSWES